MNRMFALLLGMFVAVGSAAESDSVQVYTTKHFAIYWLNAGPNAPVAKDADQNGRPDYIDTAAADLEATYRVLADSLHYRIPRGQTTTIYTRRSVPSGLYPVEILDLATVNSFWKGTRTYGLIQDSTKSPDKSPGSQIWLENDFLDNGTDSIWVAIRGTIYRNWAKEPYTALKFAVAHELYHAFTYEYDAVWKYAFHEMAAVWFESWYAPETQNHWRYLPLFRDNIIRGAFDNGNQQGYGNYLYLKAMVDLYGPDVIRKLWEDRAAVAPGNNDAEWFTAAWKNMKVDTISRLTRYYGENAVKLITGQPSAFDDGGLLTGKIDPKFTKVSFYATDTNKAHSIGAPIGLFAMCAFSMSHESLPKSNWNIAAIAGYPKLGGNLYVVHYPSKEMQAFDVSTNEVIVSFAEKDTMILLVNVNGDQENAWSYYGTTRSAGIHPRSLKIQQGFTRSFDLFGRPASSSGSSQIRIELNTDSDGARRRFGR